MGQMVPVETLESKGGESVYDSHHPPSMSLIEQCVHCGFCLPTCPTYLLWNQEMDSPRGRIYLMKMGAEGGVAQMDETFVSHFDKCLGCMACVTACPSGVQYGKLIEATRAQIERNYQRPFLDRLFRRLIFWLFPHPNRLRLLMLPLWLYQRSGLRWLLRKSGLLRLLPERLRSMESLLPEIQLRRMFLSIPRACSTGMQAAPAGWCAAGLCATRSLQQRKCGNRSRARRARLRSHRAAGARMLRCNDGAHRTRTGGIECSAASHRSLRTGRS